MKEFDEQEAFNKASEMGSKATDEDIANVANKMDSMNRGPLKKIWSKVEQLWDAFRSPDTPKLQKAMIIGGLIYMVSPLDLIPDPIPVVGLLDDVSVLLAVFSRVMMLGALVTTGIILAMPRITKETLREKLQNDEQIRGKMPESIKSKMNESSTIDLDDLEGGTEKQAPQTATAKITQVTPNSVTLDIRDAMGNTMFSAIKIESEDIDDEIQEGTEIDFAI